MIPLRILLPVCLIALFGQFLHRRGFGAQSRNGFLRLLRELNEDILCQPGRMGALAFWVYLLRLVYVVILRDTPL